MKKIVFIFLILLFLPLFFVGMTSGNSDSDTNNLVVAVAVEDTIPPTISGNYSNKTNKIVWVVKDRNPASYIIYKDGKEVFSGSWVSGENISIVAEAFTGRINNYTIVAQDTSGNSASDSIIINHSGYPEPLKGWHLALVFLVLISLAFVISALILWS